MHYPLHRQSYRRAASVVEFAVVLPVIVLLLLGAVEIGRAVMVQHTLQEVAQAGCRLYAVRDTDQSDVEDIIAQAMEKAGVKDYDVTFDPPNKSQIDANMEPVTVTVSVNYSNVAWLSPDFMDGAAITARCTMPADLEVERADTNDGDDSGDSGGSSRDDRDDDDRDSDRDDRDRDDRDRDDRDRDDRDRDDRDRDDRDRDDRDRDDRDDRDRDDRDRDDRDRDDRDRDRDDRDRDRDRDRDDRDRDDRDRR